MTSRMRLLRRVMATIATIKNNEYLCRDIITHHMIPVAPIVFLDVAKWTRKAALAQLAGLRHGPDELAYWRVVRTLCENGRAAEVAQFTAMNYGELLFDIAIKTRVAGEWVFRYHRWCDNGIQLSMLGIAMENLHILDPNVIAKLIDAKYFELSNCFVITNTLSFYFYDNGCEIFDDDAWREDLATRTVQFAIERFPQFIKQYVDFFAENRFEFDPYNLRLANGSLRCIETVLRMRGFVINARDFYRYIWRYRMVDVNMEYRDELYGEIGHRGPLWARLRRRNNTRMDQWRRFMSVRWQLEHMGRTYCRGYVRHTREYPPSACLYLTLHIDEDPDDVITDDLDDSDTSDDSDDSDIDTE